MNASHPRFTLTLTAAWAVCLLSTASARQAAVADSAAVSPLEKACLDEAEATVRAFNAADATALASMFLESGELVDEQENLTSGRAAITELFKAFFTRFPKAVLEMQVTSVRPVGEAMVVEEGERRITADEGAAAAQMRYVAIRSRQGDRWPIASYREFTDEPLPTPQEVLQSVAWLVGDWVDESPDARTSMRFAWSEDGNFLLGDYRISGPDGESTSTQRIGWDAVTGQLRSWTFDSDGGFSEGEWDPVEDGWVVKSEATMPDGTTGSATMTISVKDADHFVVRSGDRILGGVEQPDFECTIARKPPQPGDRK
jgi:uncharacterized protein (TIGR02246 family)